MEINKELNEFYKKQKNAGRRRPKSFGQFSPALVAGDQIEQAHLDLVQLRALRAVQFGRRPLQPGSTDRNILVAGGHIFFRFL